MSFAVSRRDCLRFAGGGALGLLLSPVPWKLLDDASIWSQNWPWVPIPPRGPETTRFAVCTMCSAGCALRARCVAGVPVALAAAGRNGERSGLCPIGIAGHHMPYHPARLRQPVRLERTAAGVAAHPVERAAVIAALAAAMTQARRTGERVVVADARPGRTLSWLYRQVLGAHPGGAVLTPPGAEGLHVPAEMTGSGPGGVGIDLDRVGTLVSFGAPVLDGWGAPGAVERFRGREGRSLRILQIETRPSRTALAADRWLAIRPGSAGAVALGLANVLLADGDVDTGALAAATRGREDAAQLLEMVGRFTPPVVMRASGIPAAHLTAAAQALVRNGPAVAIAGVDPGGGPLPPRDAVAVWALNLVLGAFASGGALAVRREVPGPAIASPLAPLVQLAELPAHSVRVLIVDAAPLETVLPWPAVQRVLAAEGALVVSLSPYLTGLTRHAGYVVPAPAPFEGIDEAIGALPSTRTSWALAAPLLAPPAAATPPALMLAELATAADLSAPFGGGELKQALLGRCAAVIAGGAGVVAGPEDGKRTPVAAFDSPETLWEAMTGGGTWLGDAGPAAPFPRLLPLGSRRAELIALAESAGASAAPEAREVAVMPYGWKVAAAGEALPPALSKLYRESGLRPAAPQAAISPATARACGVGHGRPARLATACGSLEVEVVVDQAVMPGVVHLATGPDPCCLGDGSGEPVSPVDLCVDEGSSTWRVARGTLSEA